jgi:hypothetical protein
VFKGINLADKEDGRGLSRRGFVARMAGILGGLIALILGIPAIGYLISPSLQKREASDEWIPLGPVEDLVEEEPTLFTYTNISPKSLTESMMFFRMNAPT